MTSSLMTSTATERCPSCSTHMVKDSTAKRPIQGRWTNHHDTPVFPVSSRQRLLLPLWQPLQGEARHVCQPDKEDRSGRDESQEEGSRVAVALVEGDHRYHLLLHCCHHLHRPQVLSPPRPCDLREGKATGGVCTCAPRVDPLGWWREGGVFFCIFPTCLSSTCPLKQRKESETQCQTDCKFDLEVVESKEPVAMETRSSKYVSRYMIRAITCRKCCCTYDLVMTQESPCFLTQI